MTSKDAGKSNGYCSYAGRLNKTSTFKCILVIIQAIRERKRELDRNNHAGFVSWIVKASDKGAGAAHKWTSMNTHAPPLPHIIEDDQGSTYFSPADNGKYYQKMWEPHWGRHASEYRQMIDILKQLILRAKQQDTALEPITGRNIKEAAQLFKDATGPCGDLWEPKWLKAMSDEAAEAMAQLLNAIEKCCAWPSHMLLNIIALMGKPPPGGARPKKLTPMIYRLWTKIRKVYIDEWGQKIVDHGTVL